MRSLMFLLVLVLFCSVPMTSSAPLSTNVANCCREFSNVKIPVKMVKSYFWTSSECPRRAIVFQTLAGKMFCVDPETTWVNGHVDKVDKRTTSAATTTTTTKWSDNRSNADLTKIMLLPRHTDPPSLRPTPLPKTIPTSHSTNLQPTSTYQPSKSMIIPAALPPILPERDAQPKPPPIHYGPTSAIEPAQSKCCGELSNVKIPVKLVKSYFWTSSNCAKRAIVFQTLAGREICVDPETTWVNGHVDKVDNRTTSAASANTTSTSTTTTTGLINMTLTSAMLESPWSPVEPVNQDVKNICIKMKKDVQKMAGITFTVYVPLCFASQIVQEGTNYLFKVEVGKNECVHVVISANRSTDQVILFVLRIQYPRTFSDPLIPF